MILKSPNGIMRNAWNGFTISRDTIHIKDISLGYENPIIGLTGDVLEEDVQVFLHKGANEVLSKPVKFKDLQGLLIRHKII